MSRKPPSLKRPLILLPLLLQFTVLFITVPIIVWLAVRADSGGPYVDERVAATVARAVDRDANGRLVVRPTSELGELRAEVPALWFVVEDDDGQTASFGAVPTHYSAFVGNLRDLSYGHFRDRSPPYRLSAVLRREQGPAGDLTVLAHGKLTRINLVVMMASNAAAIPIFLSFVLISVIFIPGIVRRSLAGVSRVAREAEQIDVSRRGMRLSEVHVPTEIAPLVRAVNAALGRLDEGYERQERFIASAAHELRTPIAILRMKVDSASESSTRRLASDVERLGNLAEQLLDLQRLNSDMQDEEIDLAGLVRGVAADLAPLLIASGRTIEVVVDQARAVRGNHGAIERVFTNLVQNAAEHGGRRLTIRVSGSTVEVEDDGPGIPTEERERVFEPFHRLRPRASGTGLGLHLVQEVVERHGGRVSILGVLDGGTIARVVFPAR